VDVEDKDDVTNQKFDNSLASLIYHDSYSGEEIDLLDFKREEEKVVTDNDVDLENVTIVIADSITKFVENSEVDTYITNLRSQNVEKIYVYKLNEIINKITNNNDNRSNKRSIADWFKEVFHQIFG
jgi:nitrogen-specific signal transduction histidine kinase